LVCKGETWRRGGRLEEKRRLKITILH
jgi:hypothetical protein